MKELYVWIRWEEGWMESIVFDTLDEAQRYGQYHWDHLTSTEKKTQIQFQIDAMNVPDGMTADKFNNDPTGEEFYAFDYITHTVHNFKEVQE